MPMAMTPSFQHRRHHNHHHRRRRFFGLRNTIKQANNNNNNNNNNSFSSFLITGKIYLFHFELFVSMLNIALLQTSE
jgi:hypothetical protein